MAQTALMPGVTATLVQNRSYALPARVVRVTSSLAVQISLDETTWTALTGADTTGIETSAPFLRCSGGNAIVTCKTL